MKLITKKAKETEALGFLFGKEVLVSVRSAFNRKHALVLALKGDLGGGKTTFLRGLAGGLGVKEKINSPTFVILKHYLIPFLLEKQGFFYHIDCYRIKGGSDLLALGLGDALENPFNVIALEWAEKVEDILPKKTIWISFEHEREYRRQITFEIAE